MSLAAVRLPVGRGSLHLDRWEALAAHVADGPKQQGYARLLAELGIDRLGFAGLVRHPRLLLAEQPGCWLASDTLLRWRLLQRLAGAGFAPGSGVESLASDAFGWQGIKRSFVQLHLHNELPPVSLLGASYLRRHRHRTYHALRLAGPAHQRLAVLLDAVLSLLQAAARSTAAFVEVAGALQRQASGPRFMRVAPLRDRRALRRLGERLGAHDLASAIPPLLAARRELAEGIGWAPFWDRVNSGFLGTTVGDLGPLLNRFLLAVGDPQRLGCRLAELCRQPAGQPIAVASLFTDDDKYRLVCFDPASQRYVYGNGDGEQRPIAWSEVRALAERGRTGGPAAVLEYLLLAASGVYLVAAPDDGGSRFERLARAIHRHYTGLPFPSVCLDGDAAQLARGSGTTYLELFDGGFAARWSVAEERFFS